MKVVIATHGHCFDGLASAVVLTRFLRAIEGPGHEFEYRACGYGIGQQTAADALLTGDQNALLDYRFTKSEKLTWYFDHHRTAFASDADRDAFETKRSTGRYHFEPSYTSCTQLIYDVARKAGLTAPEFGGPGLIELVRWADIIDSASFATPEAAIDRSSPEMRFVSVVEQHAGDAFLARMVPLLEQRPLVEVAALPEVQALYGPIGERHDQFVAAVQHAAEVRDRVVFVDLTDSPLDLVGKFVTYALHPRSMYSVIVARLKRGFKISVGYNPWNGAPLDVDISAICARFGGGGHPVVGGISIPDGQRHYAQAVAKSIARELNGERNTTPVPLMGEH